MITGQNSALLYRPEFISPSEPTGLWWVRDARDVDVVSINAVCKSVTAGWQEISGWSDWIAQFPYILIAIPPGAVQDEAVEQLTARAPVPVLVPASKDFLGCQSMEELRDNGGLKAIDRLLLNAVEKPVCGLINLADVDTTTRKNAKRVISGISGLDRAIGGFAGGELSVWTGKRGEGKSTLLGQILLDAVNQNHKVCAYSGELPKDQFKLSMLQQAAGYLHVRKREDERSGRIVYDVDRAVIQAIDEWWNNRLFLTDIQRKDAHDEDNILKLFEYANRRHGCDVFLVDNIMTASLKDEAALGFWRAQSAFTGRLVAFSKRFNVHVHLVAHPRKTQNHLEADDVGGSSDITNRADNVFSVERVPEEREQELGYSTLLTVLKNREFGARERIKLEYNEPSKRLYEAGGSPAKRYAWEEAYGQG